jgi:hypothetical protein
LRGGYLFFPTKQSVALTDFRKMKVTKYAIIEG